MKELLLKIQNFLGFAYWVEIITDKPSCTYYFGPFMKSSEAEMAKRGYIEDLEAELAQGICVTIKRCKPQNLTIFDEGEETPTFGTIPRFSGQAS